MNIQAGIEYNKLANVLHSVYHLLNQIESDILIPNFNKDIIRADLFVSSYSAKKHIKSRLQKYKWPLKGGIIVPSISSEIIPLQDAIEQTLRKLMLIADKCNLFDECEDILNGGRLYFELDNGLSDEIKNQFN